MDDLEKIEELYETVKNDPNNFQAVRELSVALLDNGFNEDALKQLVYLVGIFPEDARLYFNIGFAFEKLKMNEKAEYSYRKAISIDENGADYYYNLAYLLLSQNKNLDEAENLLKKVLELEPNDANTYFNLGMINFKNENFKEAINYFQKSFDLNSYDILPLFYLANTYQKMNEDEKAKEIYLKVIELSPEYSWAYFNLAQIAWKNEEVGETIENLNKTLEINPKDIVASKLLSQIYLRAEQYDKAQAVLNNAIEQNPYCGDLYYFLSKTYPDDKTYHQKYLKKALENYKNLSISPNQIKKELNKLRQA